MKAGASRHQRFYLPPGAIDGREAVFSGSESSHISQSLRLGKGDVVTATDGEGGLYEIAIEQARPNRVTGCVVRSDRLERRGARIWVFQGAIRPSKMEWAVDKCTELGIAGWVAVPTERSERRVGPRRLERLRRLAVEAMKQSLGAYLPEIDAAESFDDALARSSNLGHVFAAWEGEKEARLKDLLTSEMTTLALWIGPEGGLSGPELEALGAVGARTFTLGARRLKAETAAVVSVALAHEMLAARLE